MSSLFATLFCAFQVVVVVVGKQLNKMYKYIQMSIEVLSCPSVRPSVLTLLHNLRAWISCQIHEPIRAINNWIAICLRIAEHKVRVCKGRNGTMDEWYVSCTYLQYICTYVCEYFLQFSWDKYRERDRVLIETTRCSIVKQRVNCNCLLSPWQANFSMRSP